MKKLLVVTIVIGLLLVSSPAFALRTFEVLAVTTSAAQSALFVVKQGQLATVIFTGTVGATETGTIQISNDNGTTWISATDQLTDTDLVRVIVAPGKYRVNKSATAAATGIYVAM